MPNENRKVPEHVAIIMDGNGRWAKEKGLPRTMGHYQGAKVVEQILEDADSLGIKYLTVYAFSTENWSRPQNEVDVLMALLDKYLRSNIERCVRKNVRVRILGDRSALSAELLAAIREMEEGTKDCTGIGFQIAINYGGRDEIVRAVRALAEDVAAGHVLPDQVDEGAIARRLDTSFMPDPDLLIRTAGDERISNFLLWQSAYTELYFTPVYWPDFTMAHLKEAVESFGGRDRRYGGVKA